MSGTNGSLMSAELSADFWTYLRYTGEGLLGSVVFTYFPLALQSEISGKSQNM